jgi:hypothetical protein
MGVGLAVYACGPRIEGLDPSKLPDDVRDDYTLFATRCSKCHSLARPLNSGITDDEQWVLYVNRMRRQPGSGISLTDQEHILHFLRYYAAELRRRAAEKRGDTAPSASASASPAPSSPPSPPTPPAPAPPASGAP